MSLLTRQEMHELLALPLLEACERWVEASEIVDKTSDRIRSLTGMEPEEVMDGMRRLLAPAQ